MSNRAKRIAITGGAGYIGTRMIGRLEGEPAVERILAIDIRPLPKMYSSKVVYRRLDVTMPLVDALREHDIDVLLHLAFILEPGHDRAAIRRVNLFGLSNTLDASVRAGVEHLLYFGSTTVYGAHADNPPVLTEESPMRPVTGFQYGEDKAESEIFIGDFIQRHPEITLTILRGCPVMGPNADNFISRAFSKPVLIGIRGYDPPLQLLHEKDLENIMARCILERIPGLYNVAGNGVLTWSMMGRILGRKLLRLPAILMYGLTGATWALRLQSESPAQGLDFIRYPWTASTEKIQRELGVRFRYSARDAWESFAMRLRGHTLAQGAED